MILMLNYGCLFPFMVHMCVCEVKSEQEQPCLEIAGCQGTVP